MTYCITMNVNHLDKLENSMQINRKNITNYLFVSKQNVICNLRFNEEKLLY